MAATDALAYAARGWHVFVLSESKSPVRNCEPCRTDHPTAAAMEACACLTCHGFYAATVDPDRIEQMLHDHPRGMLAIRTGAVSGLAVIDVDFREWAEDGPAVSDPAWLTMSDLDRRGLLPGTLMQTTASGGLHLLHAHPGGYLTSGAKKYGPGIDSKADGGYIVAAPSTDIHGRQYVWTPDGRRDHPLTMLPEPLAALLRPAVTELAQPRPFGQVASSQPLVRAQVEGILRTLSTKPEHERNDCLHWAACRVAGMLVAGDLDDPRAAADLLATVALDAGLTPGEVVATINSGFRKYGVSA